MALADALKSAMRCTGCAGFAILLASATAAPTSGAQRETVQTSLDLVVIDVAVSDNKGNPVTDLQASDFRVKEDGQVMDVKTFNRVAEEDEGPVGDGRSVALLLDDAGVSSLGSNGIKDLSKAVLSLAHRNDLLSVVRLHVPSDEAYGDMTEALARIDGYHASSRPFSLSEMQADALNRIAAMSDQLAINEGRRKAVVCIGTQLVCDPQEPGNDSRQEVWNAWRRAVTSAARSNVAVYAIIPGRIRMRGGGIADATGGMTYASYSDFREPIVTLWNDSATHYMLGYWPGQKSREIHSISVSVSRPKVKVRARRQRGE